MIQYIYIGIFVFIFIILSINTSSVMLPNDSSLNCTYYGHWLFCPTTTTAAEVNLGSHINISFVGSTPDNNTNSSANVTIEVETSSDPDAHFTVVDWNHSLIVFFTLIL